MIPVLSVLSYQFFEKKKNVVIVGFAGAAQRFRPVGNEEVRGRRGSNGE